MAHRLLSSLHSYLGDSRDTTDTKLCPLSHTQVLSHLMPKNRSVGDLTSVYLGTKEEPLEVFRTLGKF